MVEEHNMGVYIAQEESEQAVNTNLHMGKRVFLHQTASGKAILAYTPRSRVEKIIDQRGLNRMTDNTVTDREELFGELDETKERGYAIDDREWYRGLRCIAAPIPAETDVVVLAQASMAHLKPNLTDYVDIPILSSPDLAMEAVAAEVGRMESP